MLRSHEFVSYPVIVSALVLSLDRVVIEDCMRYCIREIIAVFSYPALLLVLVVRQDPISHPKETSFVSTRYSFLTSLMMTLPITVNILLSDRTSSFTQLLQIPLINLLFLFFRLVQELAVGSYGFRSHSIDRDPLLS